jgi:hypothetical protein
VQDEPVVGVEPELVRARGPPARLRVQRLPGDERDPVRDAEDVGVDRDPGIPNAMLTTTRRGLAPDARQGLQDLDGRRHLAAELLDEPPRQGDHVLGLGAEEVDRLHVVEEALLAEVEHLCGVSATWNRARVALLTPASVAWAESTTATRSV